MTTRRNYLGFLALLLSGAMFLTTSCDNTSQTTIERDDEITGTEIPEQPTVGSAPNLAVAPPIQGVDVPFENYKVKVTKGATLETPTGSTIEIPADAFIDKNGNPIKGEVSIKFREFHDATAIIASGIPMHDPETGKHMETAGMFEIKGEHNGEEIFVKADKDIQVNLASYNKGNDFQFYELGAKDCRWKDKGTATAQVNTNKQNKLRALNTKLTNLNEGKPRKANEVKNYVFDLDINYGRFPELAPFKNVIWEYTGKGPNPEKNDWIFSQNWEDIKLEKNKKGDYTLKLIQLEGKSFATNVRPVLDGEDYAKALALFNQKKGNEVEQIKADLVSEKKQLERQADLTRAFKVGNFGTFNWDIWKDPARVRCKAEILVDNEDISTQKFYQKASYFLVTNNRRSVIRYTGQTLSKFSFNPMENNTLLVVTQEGYVATFSAKKFKKLDATNLMDSKVVFDLIPTAHQVKNLNDLNKIITEAVG